jgi:hypothetical protein
MSAVADGPDGRAKCGIVDVEGHMTRGTLAIGAFVMRVIACAPVAFGQVLLPDNGQLPDNEWRHGSTLEVFAGTATAAEDTRGAFGGALGWEINHRVAVEGTGAWLVARQGDEAFAAELTALTNLTRPHLVVPFLGAGVGLYHASFDTTRGDIPAFYQGRLVAGSFGSLATFNDPSFVFDAGVNVFAARHVSFRPEVSVRLVTRDSATYAVTMATFHLTYHFEVHGVAQ